MAEAIRPTKSKTKTKKKGVKQKPESEDDENCLRKLPSVPTVEPGEDEFNVHELAEEEQDASSEANIQTESPVLETQETNLVDHGSIKHAVVTSKSEDEQNDYSKENTEAALTNDQEEQKETDTSAELKYDQLDHEEEQIATVSIDQSVKIKAMIRTVSTERESDTEEIKEDQEKERVIIEDQNTSVVLDAAMQSSSEEFVDANDAIVTENLQDEIEDKPLSSTEEVSKSYQTKEENVEELEVSDTQGEDSNAVDTEVPEEVEHAEIENREFEEQDGASAKEQQEEHPTEGIDHTNEDIKNLATDITEAETGSPEESQDGLLTHIGTQLCHVASIVCDMTSTKRRVTMIDDVKEIEQAPDNNEPDNQDSTSSTQQEQYSESLYTAESSYRIPRMYPVLPSSPCEEIQPLSPEQLKSLYHNRELDYLDQAVDEFLKTAQPDKHEFYELVLNYYRACNNLEGAKQDSETLTKDYDRLRDLVWRDELCTVTGQGQCADKVKVIGEHKYVKVRYDQKACDNLQNILKEIRTHIHEALSLHAYSAQISRLQVEDYICDMYKKCPSFNNIPPNAPGLMRLSGTRELIYQQQISWLRECISILFTFQRKPTKSYEFLKDSRKWIQLLVSTLLRLATLDDHIFIISHLMRCPAGVGKWAANLIQVSCPKAGESVVTTAWGSPLLDHSITVLAVILKPIKQRDDFLHQMASVVTPINKEHTENPWIMIDSDGEEDDDPANSWRFLNEGDVISMLDQLPLADIFKHVLLIGSTEGYQDVYNVQLTSEAGMLKLYAFASCVVQLLGEGLQHYNQVRYKQLNKRLGHIVRAVVSYISDHWENFLQAWSHLPQSTLLQLQVEFDQFFRRATNSVLQAQKLGSWQILADLPYKNVSINMMWELLWDMHCTTPESNKNLSVQEISDIMQDKDSRQMYGEQLVHMPTYECICLLTTFSNMARARKPDAALFIQTVVTEIFEISYISEHSRELCYKVGRDLLSSVGQQHTFTMSVLLHKVKETLEEIGTTSLYLFRELPWHLWQPREVDLQVLKDWLLHKDLNSTESLVAREVIQGMNWGKTKQGRDLFLPVETQRQVALLLLGAYQKHVKEKHMASFITEGLKQAASAVMFKLTVEQQFSNWLWEVVLQLHLHKQQHPHLLDPGGTEWLSGVPVLSSDSTLYSVQKGVKDRCPYAMYVAMMMTSAGHSAVEICDTGIGYLNELVYQHHHIPVIRILSCITMVFSKHQDYLLKNDKYVAVLQGLLSGDYSKLSLNVFGGEFPGPVTNLSSTMIQDQVRIASDAKKTDVLSFWLKSLTRIPKWNSIRDVQYVLDQLIRLCFSGPQLWDAVTQFFSQFYKDFVNSHRDSGVLSSIVSWLSTGHTLPSFMDGSSWPEFPWLAYTILHAEGQYESDTGLWPALREELLENTTTVDQALRKVCQNLKLSESPLLYRMSIYRWAQQALDTPVDHILLPILWQRFFLVYLGRHTSQQGMPERGGVGEKFFESSTNTSLQKRLRQRLNDTAQHYHKLQRDSEIPQSHSQQPHGDHDGFEREAVMVESVRETQEQQFRESLIKIYQTLAFWLDEPRLHDPNLYLPALPPQYDAERLLQLFQNQLVLWKNFVSDTELQKQITQAFKHWAHHLTENSALNRKISALLKHEDSNATGRILVRLRQHPKPKGPPSIEKLESAVPQVNKTILLDKDNLLYALKADFSTLVNYARQFCDQVSSHVHLDHSYLEWLPSLHKNMEQEVVLSIGCVSKFNPTHRCSGPASILCSFMVKQTNEIVHRKVGENRVEFNQLLLRSRMPPPSTVCCAAVHIRNTIVALAEKAHESRQKSGPSVAEDVGITLFYHISKTVNDETRYYPPTCQFFSSCIEMLGQEFIRNNPTQSTRLLKTILKTPAMVGMLGPNYRPNISPKDFVEMYSELADVPVNQGPDLAFTLLSKFDLGQWLYESRPALSERSRLVGIIIESLSICGPEVGDAFLLVFELYRSHLQILLRYQFPDHFGDVLKGIMNGSSEEALNPLCWQDFLLCLGCDIQGRASSKAAPTPQQEEPLVMPDSLAKESLQWLTAFFDKQRRSQEDSMNFGIYPKWRNYSRYLARLLAYLMFGITTNTANSVREGRLRDPETVVGDVWQILSDSFSPWISPINTHGKVYSPWVEPDSNLASDMVAMFTANIEHLQAEFNNLVPFFAMDAFNLLWPFYVNKVSQSGTPDHVISVFHARMSVLSWTQFRPSMSNIELMVKLLDENPRCCSMFLSEILPTIDWPTLINVYCTHEIGEMVTRLHICILTLLVRLGTDKVIVQNVTFPRLLQTSESFNWSCLDAGSYTEITEKFVKKVDASCVISDRTSGESRMLNVIKISGEFRAIDPGSPTSPEAPVKRCQYVKCIVLLLCQTSHNKDANIERMGIVITNLFTEVENVLSSVLDYEQHRQESVTLLKEVLNLYNNCNPQGAVLDQLMERCLEWLRSSQGSILLLPMVTAAGQTLASLAHMVDIIETSLEAHFCAEFPSHDRTQGWTGVLEYLHFPEMGMEDFLTEAIHRGSYLLLHAYFLQQVPLALCTDQRQELRLLMRVIDWTKRAKPRQENEAKLLLLWFKVFEMLTIQVNMGTELEQISHCVKNLIHPLGILGEDKASAGFFGSIGFGKKSALSTRFRLVCKSLTSFLQAQLLSDGVVRIQEGAPHTDTSQPITSSQKSNQSHMAHLESLRSNKSYSELAPLVEFSIDFTRNSRKCLKDVTQLLKNLTLNMFADKGYLKVILKSEY